MDKDVEAEVVKIVLARIREDYARAEYCWSLREDFWVYTRISDASRNAAGLYGDFLIRFGLPFCFDPPSDFSWFKHNWVDIVDQWEFSLIKSKKRFHDLCLDGNVPGWFIKKWNYRSGRERAIITFAARAMHQGLLNPKKDIRDEL